jgi:two-component system phosphate regulon sensor histidine kinase PhoR
VSGIRLKIMGVLAILVVAVVLIAGIPAESRLRARELAQLEQSLRQRAALVAENAAGVPFRLEEASRLDALADRAGRAAGARVTLISVDGTVVGDSDVSLQRLPSVENHGGRPEVREAVAGRVGVSARRSDTIGRRLLYLAAPARGARDSGVVRLAVELADVEAAVSELRSELLLAGALGLVAALALSFPLSWLGRRPLLALRDAIAAVAEGRLGHRMSWAGRDEIGEIARSINRVAEQLRLRLDETTAEKERLEAVLSSMVEGVLVLDQRGDIAMVTPRLRELLGVWGEVQGRSAIEVFRHPGLDRVLTRARDSSQPVADELEVDDAGGSRILVHAVGFRGVGEGAGTVAVFHDVTELHRLEQVRRDFISNASHELRTPLTAIRGFAETLLESPLSREEQEPQLQAIARNAGRMSTLIDDLLALTRMESRKFPLRPAEVDVAAIARTLVEDLGPRLEEASLEARVEGEGDATAWADRRGVEQVLSNLLENAIQYSDPGGAIEIALEGDDRRLRVRVRDAGIGIAEFEQSRIFERFYRVDEARSRALGGTGLGLSIVKHLVQGMGGEVGVESEPGRGSCFTFTLPRSEPVG